MRLTSALHDSKVQGTSLRDTLITPVGKRLPSLTQLSRPTSPFGQVEMKGVAETRPEIEAPTFGNSFQQLSSIRPQRISKMNSKSDIALLATPRVNLDK